MSSLPDATLPHASAPAAPGDATTSPGQTPEPGLWQLMRADIAGMVIDTGKGAPRYGLEVALKILLFPRIQGVLLFRLSHACHRSRLGLVAYWLQGMGLRRCGAEIHPAARIGPGFCLVHSAGVVIGDRTQIGAHFICFQNVTVGDSGRGDGQPVLGDWVTASAGAKILGGISVGSGATVGANSVLLRDVPEGAVAVGAPARVAKIRAVDEQGRPLKTSGT